MHEHVKHCRRSGGLVISPVSEAIEALFGAGSDTNVLLLPGVDGRDRIARLACQIRSHGFSVMIADGPLTEFGSELVTAACRAPDVHAVLAPEPIMAPSLHCLSSCTLVFCENQGWARIIILSNNAATGWQLWDMVAPFGYANRAPGSMACAGLMVCLEPGIESRNSGIKQLRIRLAESGIMVRDISADCSLPQWVRVFDTKSELCGGLPAIGIDLAGQNEPPLPVWIQVSPCLQRHMPVIVHALEAIAATPLGQWRRWLA